MISMGDVLGTFAGGEESDTPKSVPTQFQSEPPSPTRDERTAAGHKGAANVFFTRDLTKAEITVKIEGVDLKEITMVWRGSLNAAFLATARFHLYSKQPISGGVCIDVLYKNDTLLQARDVVLATSIAVALTLRAARYSRSHSDRFRAVG
jgi:hypothetical protein